MVRTERFMAASDAMLKNRFTFQNRSKKRYSTCSLASSNALANAAPSSLDPVREPRLTPKPISKMESSVERIRRSEMSSLSPAPRAAAATMPASSAAVSRNTALL